MFVDYCHQKCIHYRHRFRCLFILNKYIVKKKIIVYNPHYLWFVRLFVCLFVCFLNQT
jgi:hypothetical protein